MKPGRRALGVAESYRGTDDAGARSTLAGAVVRADRAVDGLVFAECTVGGTDATDALVDAWRRLDREDTTYLFLSGVSLAWYNVVDVERLAAAVDRPVIAVTYEDGHGVADGIADAFDGGARQRRLATHESLPPRRHVEAVGEGPLYVRSAGVDPGEADRALAAFTHERRPEPIRVAKLAARAADGFRRD